MNKHHIRAQAHNNLNIRCYKFDSRPDFNINKLKLQTAVVNGAPLLGSRRVQTILCYCVICGDRLDVDEFF